MRPACYAILAGNPEPRPTLDEITLRVSQLSQRSQQDVLTMIKWAQAAEQQHRLDDTFPALPHLSAVDEHDA